jgi:hypothetical protein
MDDAPRKLSPQALVVISWVGTATFLFILAGGLVVAGALAAASRRVL